MSGFERLAATIDAQTEIGRLRQALFIAEATIDQLHDQIATLERHAVAARAEVAALTGQRDRALADVDRWAAAAIESRDAAIQRDADLAEAMRLATAAEILRHELRVKTGVELSFARARDIAANMYTPLALIAGVAPADRDEPTTEAA